MKNIFKTVALIAAASFALLACNKEAPSKADVEKGFTPITKTLPTLSIAETVTFDFGESAALVSVTVTGLDETLDSLEVGILSSTTEDFAKTSFTKCKNPAEGVNSMPATVRANTTFYLKAVVSSTIGTVYSDAISVEVPDFPFWSKIKGKWKGDLVSEAYGDEYTNTFTILSDPDDPEHKAIICDFEPYYHDALPYGYPDGFYCVADIDNDAKTITIPDGADYHYYNPDKEKALYICGLNAPKSANATGYAALVLTATDDTHLVQENGFQPYVGGSGPEDSYAGGVTYTLQ